MSETVELVRLGLETFQREGAEALLSITDPEIEVYTEPGLVNSGTYRGHEGFMRWQQQWMEAWEEFRMEPAEFIEVSDEIVVVPLHQVATGKGSGIEVEMDIAYLFEVRDGRLTRLHLYADKGRALSAAERLAGEG